MSEFPETRDPNEKREWVGTVYHCLDTDKYIVIVDNDPQIEIVRLSAELEAVKYAAHMPEDYQYNLASWIDQYLYASYIGASFSPSVMERIESGKLTFRNAPIYKKYERLLKRFKAAEAIVKVVLDGQRREFLSSVEALVPDALIEAWLSSKE